MKKISSRQIIAFYFIYSFAIKFLMLPHFLSSEAGRDGWLAAALGSIFELALLLIVIKTITMQQDTDIYSGLRKKISSPGAKIVMSVLLLFFLLQALITIKHTNYLLSETLYEDLGLHLFAIPLLILGIFFCYSKTRAVFRSTEIFYILVIAGIALALLPSIGKVNANEVLPVLDKGLRPVFKGFYNNLIYFESAIVLLMFMGDIKIKQSADSDSKKDSKLFCRTFMIWAAIGAAVFVAFVFFYYSVFGPLSTARPLSLINITQESSYISQNGRLEWIIVCIWLILMLLRFGIIFYCCFAALRYITHIRFQPAAIAFPLALFIYIIHAAVIVSIADLNKFINALKPFILALYVAIPVLFLIISCLNKRKPKDVENNTKDLIGVSKKRGEQNV